MNSPGGAESVQKSSVVVAVIGLLMVIGVGAALIGGYVERERERDLQQWESRIGLVADAKVAAIDRLIADDLQALRDLAGNASVQLYLGKLVGNPDDVSAQAGYLRNLLRATAIRMALLPVESEPLPANLSPPEGPGLGLFDTQLRPMATTPGILARRPSIDAAARQALANGEPVVTSLFRDDRGRTLMAYVLPVAPVLGTDSASVPEPVGLLVALRDAGQRLFPVLADASAFSQDNEALLLEARGDQVVYLSPARDGADALRRSMPLARERLAAAAAVQNPGRFAQLDNYQGEPVLQVSRELPGTPWVLAQQVDAAQALRESDARRRYLVTALSLILLSVTALIIAAWQHGSSVRARDEARAQAEITAKIRRRTDLLHAITDNIRALTMLVDRQWQILFTNEALARAVNSQIPDLVGKHLNAAVGPAIARDIKVGAEEAERDGVSSPRSLRLQFGGETRSYRASFIPIEAIGDLRDVMLVVLDDITELELAETRHANLLTNLVSTLAQVIDRHDPYSAFHSARMTEVASLLAAELRLPQQERRTVEFAATLANIGKLMLPRELLLKTEELSEDERKQLETHVSRGVALLRSLDFEGPVLSTIAQKQEHLDGSGYPRHLTADDMTVPGKILAVANAFVALVSPRAYRDAIPVAEALDMMMDEADRKYDRHVMAALMHVAENRIDWSRWRRQDAAG